MTHEAKRAAEAYDAVESHEELIWWSRVYCTHVVTAHSFDVMFGPACWEASTRARRHAAVVKTSTIKDASVGRTIDWSTRANGFRESTPSEYTMSLSWQAFESFDREEWPATPRHEPAHVKRFQAFGATDHGPAFKRRAETVDVPVCVRWFAEPKYTLSCEVCGADVAYCYYECKLVRESPAYCSACCEAPLHCRKRRE